MQKQFFFSSETQHGHTCQRSIHWDFPRLGVRKKGKEPVDIPLMGHSMIRDSGIMI